MGEGPPNYSDAVVRAHGFEIVSRPECGPPLWRRAGTHTVLPAPKVMVVARGEIAGQAKRMLVDKSLAETN